MEINDVMNVFEKEFVHLRDRFQIYDLTLDRAKYASAEGVVSPGVYVFWKGGKVIKVGRNLTNSRKRALQHIKDNTGGYMKALEEDSETHLLLFNVKNSDDRHWVAALEVFFEMRLEPQIRAHRLG